MVLLKANEMNIETSPISFVYLYFSYFFSDIIIYLYLVYPMQMFPPTHPYKPAVAFQASALTLKWSNTTVTCSFGVASSVYVQLVCEG